MKKIYIILLLLLLSFIVSYTSEIDVVLSGYSEQKEKIFLTENMKIKNKLYDVDLKEGSGIVLYYYENKIIKEEIYYNVKFKKEYSVLYNRENIEEESKILSGIQKNIEYYDYADKRIKKISLYSGKYKIFEMKINEKGEIKNIIEGKCKKFISFISKENCKKQNLFTNER